MLLHVCCLSAVATKQEKASMPFREETGIIQGFDQILTELAIFRTRKVHPPV
jgi:hypothetical protein